MRTRTMIAVLLLQAALPVNSLQFSEPARVVELDMDDLKGQPSRLAWSNDGSQLYVQTLEGTFGLPGNKLRHYVFTVKGGEKKDVPVEPDWASAYWTLKSNQTAPDLPTFRIEPKKDTKTHKTTSSPMGGDLAKGGGSGTTGSSSGDAISASHNQQTVAVVTLQLLGETIGQWENAPMVPGQTFGWGPKDSRVIAFSRVNGGKVVVMDDKGTKKEVPASKDASFPAWSPDGSKIAWLQKDGKKKYILQVTSVTSGS